MSPAKVNVVNNAITFDFSLQNSFNASPAFGQKNKGGSRVMYVSDYDQNDQLSYDITGIDKILWNTEKGNFGAYFSSDGNLDGDVNGADKIKWSVNSGIYSPVPK